MVEPVAGLAAQLLFFEPPYPQETLREGLVDCWFEGLIVSIINGREKNYLLNSMS